MNVASTDTHNPITAITAKDKRRLETPARMPISGGPIKKPRKLMADTDASAMPGDIFFDFPAALNTSGTIDETPMPTNENPAIAVYRCGNKTAISKPAIVSKPLI